MNQYRYLIGFFTSHSNGHLGYGRIDVTRAAPITNDQDVAAVERNLRNHTADPALTVVSFSRYTDPTPGR
jgi:hypothetical protein